MSDTRFAVSIHLLALLAIEGQTGPLTSEVLATSAGTNPVVVRRLLAQLRRGGLVTIQSGCNGGARLARPADAITLLDVQRALGEIEPFALGKRRPDPDCITGRNLAPVLSGVLQQAGQAMALFLQGITVAQIVGEIRRRDVPGPQTTAI